MINIAINKAYENALKTSWIDVKKAFDSIEHSYLIKCIKSYNFPDWIIKFIEIIISKWKLDIRSNNTKILEKTIQKGILQGDSLSPLLFVLCMDPLSRKLNSKYPTLQIPAGDNMHCTNHLLFIDDLKLLAENEETLDKLMKETKNFFNVICLEMNKEKSASNTPICQEDTSLLANNQCYKYLGIIETAKSEVSSENLKKIKAEIINRTENLCKSKLNGKIYLKL